MKNYRGRRRDYLLLLAALVTYLSAGMAVEALDRHDAAQLQQVEPVPAVVEVQAAKSSASYQQVTSKLNEPEPVSLGEFKITHYCPGACCCGEWADGYTSTGTKATEGRTIAVDPDVIPYGTEVLVVYEDGTEAVYVAEDCGGAIQGNRIDVYMDSHEAALVEGVKTAKVYMVEG